MNWFGTKQESARMTRKMPNAQDVYLARHGALVRAAMGVEADILAKIPIEKANNEREHERQVAAYKFECRRYGDFLALFVERPIKDWRSDDYIQKKFATAVNIAATRELRMDAGHLPDFSGTVMYRARNCVVVVDGIEQKEPPVYADYATDSGRRLLFSLDEKDKGNSHWAQGSKPVAYRTENFPRPAKDDRIRFEGIGATVFAPAGCGQAVYDAILKEIEAYREMV